MKSFPTLFDSGQTDVYDVDDHAFPVIFEIIWEWGQIIMLNVNIKRSDFAIDIE